MYCGCRTCCGKLTWCFTVLFLLAATVGLALGLYFTVPCTRVLVACNPAVNANCWNDYWVCTGSQGGRLKGVYFFLSVAGAACFILSLLTCCCFCCQRGPRQKAKKQDQFISGGSPTPAAAADTAPAGYSDQYAPGYQPYDPYATNKPSVAHV